MAALDSDWLRLWRLLCNCGTYFDELKVLQKASNLYSLLSLCSSDSEVICQERWPPGFWLAETNLQWKLDWKQVLDTLFPVCFPGRLVNTGFQSMVFFCFFLFFLGGGGAFVPLAQPYLLRGKSRTGNNRSLRDPLWQSSSNSKASATKMIGRSVVWVYSEVSC